jgi:hypothetical protein
MFKDLIVSPDLNTIPHELYHVHRDPNSNLLVYNLQVWIELIHV